jgi:hypothetical protein
MPVEIVVDSIDAVEESLRPAYVENEGKYHLDVDKYAEVKAQGLKSKNKELLTKLNESKTGLKRFEKFAELEDDDLNELLELREQKNNPPAPGTKPKGADELQANFEKAMKTAEGRWQREKGELETKLSEGDKALRYYQLTVPVREAAAKAGVLAEDMALVLKDTEEHFALGEDRKPVVIQDGEPTDITLDKFFQTLYREQRPKFYAASGASGSGAPSSVGSPGGKRAMTRANWGKLSPSQQQAFMKDVRDGKAALVD